jgi:hypothetical protein
MNKLIFINPNLKNIIWIERGIKTMLIYFIIKYYNIIKNKNIIIENKDYRRFCKNFFTELTFKKFNINNTDYDNNFYFNIRNKIIKRDIFIDDLNNYYNKYIPTKKIYLIPWFDINEPIICYKYRDNYKLNYYKEYNKIMYFGNFNRNINNKLWDLEYEYIILNKYKNYKSIKYIKYVYRLFFSLLKQYYSSNKIQRPIIKYINRIIERPFIIKEITKPIIVENDELQDKIIDLANSTIDKYKNI